MKITKQGVTATLALWLVLAALTQSLAQSFGPPLPAGLQPISSLDSLPDSAVFYGISDFPDVPPLPLGVALDHPDTPLYWSPSANAVFADDREETVARLLLHAAQDSGIPGFGDGGGDDGGGGGSQITYSGTPIDTNGLWLEITNADLSLAYLNLHHPTNQVYAILSTTNLLTTWQIETELWPTNQDVMPFTIPTLDRQALFLQAEDWTTVDSDADGIPDWWIWLYFGNLNETATNLDTQGNTLGYDYTNSLDPNVISFALSATNSYVNQTAVTLQVSLLAGTPSYYAVLVNDPSPQDATWLALYRNEHHREPRLRRMRFTPCRSGCADCLNSRSKPGERRNLFLIGRLHPYISRVPPTPRSHIRLFSLSGPQRQGAFQPSVQREQPTAGPWFCHQRILRPDPAPSDDELLAVLQPFHGGRNERRGHPSDRLGRQHRHDDLRLRLFD